MCVCVWARERLLTLLLPQELKRDVPIEKVVEKVCLLQGPDSHY
jgi:hypothetical protein